MKNININELIENYRATGNQLVFEEIFNENKKIIYSIINKVYNMEKEDAYQLACLGFVKAVNTFDTSKDIKFSTYAYKVVCNEVYMEIRKNKKKEENKKEKNIKVISYDESISDNDDRQSILDTIIDENAFIADKILANEQHKELYELIDKYSKKNKMKAEVIKLMLTDCYIQEEIAEKVGCTRSYVSKIYLSFEEYVKENMVTA